MKAPVARLSTVKRASIDATSLARSVHADHGRMRSRASARRWRTDELDAAGRPSVVGSIAAGVVAGRRGIRPRAIVVSGGVLVGVVVTEADALGEEVGRDRAVGVGEVRGVGQLECRCQTAGLRTYPAPRMVWIIGSRPASIFLRR